MAKPGQAGPTRVRREEFAFAARCLFIFAFNNLTLRVSALAADDAQGGKATALQTTTTTSGAETSDRAFFWFAH